MLNVAVLWMPLNSGWMIRAGKFNSPGFGLSKVLFVKLTLGCRMWTGFRSCNIDFGMDGGGSWLLNFLTRTDMTIRILIIPFRISYNLILKV